MAELIRVGIVERRNKFDNELNILLSEVLARVARVSYIDGLPVERERERVKLTKVEINVLLLLVYSLLC